MRLRISHSTTTSYDPPASGVIQVLRLTPGNHDGQYVADWNVDLSVDVKLDVQHDAFGNVTHVFTHVPVGGPLESLTVHVSGLVETQDTGGVLKGATERFPPGFFLRATPLTEANAEMIGLSRTLHTKFSGNTLGFLHELLVQLGEHMTHAADAAGNGTTAAEAFTAKQGGCQDFAHIFAACARSAGVPARFVCGHLFRPGQKAAQTSGHAWVEAHVPDLGWIGFDPVSGICTTDAHARVAIGLDYLGAAPVRGTRYGGGVETSSVAVTVDQAGRQNQ
jgi:transglutaminase-like putative cysteine protease